MIVNAGFDRYSSPHLEGDRAEHRVGLDAREYFTDMRGVIAAAYRPEDGYAGNLVSALGAIEAGITTLLDWSHILNTPEHADAAIRG